MSYFESHPVLDEIKAERLRQVAKWGEPIPVRKLADAVDAYALGPAAEALSTPDNGSGS